MAHGSVLPVLASGGVTGLCGTAVGGTDGAGLGVGVTDATGVGVGVAVSTGVGVGVGSTRGVGEAVGAGVVAVGVGVGDVDVDGLGEDGVGEGVTLVSLFVTRNTTASRHSEPSVGLAVSQGFVISCGPVTLYTGGACQVVCVSGFGRGG